LWRKGRMWALIEGSVSKSARRGINEVYLAFSSILTVVDARRMDEDGRVLPSPSGERRDEGVIGLKKRMRGVVVGWNPVGVSLLTDPPPTVR